MTVDPQAADASNDAEADSTSGHTETDGDGHVTVDLDDAGGRELRDVDEKPPDEEVAEIEAERERRLDAEHRPDGAEVDNTHRDFDSAVGMFTDDDDYDPDDQRYAPEEDAEG